MASHFLRRLGETVIPPVAYLLFRGIESTMRIRHLDHPDLEALSREGIIFVFWHQRLLMMGRAIKLDEGYALISRSRDGELISRFMAFFDLKSVRGSSHRGGSASLRELERLLLRGACVGITPDGPRGPARKAKPGAVQLAAATGRPIVGISFSASRRWQAGSWDAFMVPLPFARGFYTWSAPIWVGQDDDREARIAEMEEMLNNITRRADEMAGG